MLLLPLLPTFDINTDTRVRICMLAGLNAHIGAPLWMHIWMHTQAHIHMSTYARARARSVQVVYVLRNARPVSTVA